MFYQPLCLQNQQKNQAFQMFFVDHVLPIQPVNLYKDLQVGLEAHGPQKTFEMLDFFAGFEDKEVGKTIYADIINKDPEQFDKIGKALAQLSVMDGRRS